MSVQVAPPLSVRKTCPGWLPDPFHPEKTTIALVASAGCVVTQVAARFGSVGLLGRGAFVTSFQLLALSVVTQTFPLSVVTQIVPATPAFGALWMFRMLS